MIDFNYSFTPSGRVRVNGKVLTKYELGSFIHRHSIELGLGYYRFLHASIYSDHFSYNELSSIFNDFLNAIR